MEIAEASAKMFDTVFEAVKCLRNDGLGTKPGISFLVTFFFTTHIITQ